MKYHYVEVTQAPLESFNIYYLARGQTCECKSAKKPLFWTCSLDGHYRLECEKCITKKEKEDADYAMGLMVTPK